MPGTIQLAEPAEQFGASLKLIFHQTSAGVGIVMDPR